MLLEHDIQLEDFGGDVQCVCISARKVSFHVLTNVTIALQSSAVVIRCRLSVCLSVCNASVF